MKKFKLLSLLLTIAMVLCLFPVQAMALDTPALVSNSAVLMDTATGDILYQKNGGQPVQPGLITSLMTALLVGDAVNDMSIALDDEVTVTDNFRYNLVEGVPLTGLVAGEVLTVGDLLYCMLFGSATDAANILAEYVSGSAGAFVTEMNDKAQDLGCTGTTFVNANGIEVAGQQTTALDLALIAQALTENTTVLSLFSVTAYTVPATNVADVRSLYNPNAIIDPNNGYYYEHAYGFKAVANSDGCIMVAGAEYNEMDVIAVVTGSPDGDTLYTDTRTMLDWLYGNFSYRELVSTTESLETIPVEMGNPDTVDVCGEEPVRIMLPNDQELGEVTYDITYLHEQEGKNLQAPVTVGQHLGDVTVYVNGLERGTGRLVAATGVDMSRMEYLRAQMKILGQNDSIRQLVTILLVLLGAYIVLVAVYTIQRLLHLHSLRKARKARARSRAQQELEWLDIPTGNAPEADEPEEEVPAGLHEAPPADAAPEEVYEDAPAEEEYQDAPPEEDDGYTEEEGYAAEEEYAQDEGYADEGEYAEGDGYADDGGYAQDNGYAPEGDYPSDGGRH